MSKKAANHRGWGLTFLLSAALAGCFLVMMGGEGVKWPLVVVISLAGALFLFFWGNLREGALFGFITTCPVYIGKALISAGGTAYASGYILLVADIFFSILVLLWLYDVMVKGIPVTRFRMPHLIVSIFVLWVVGTSIIKASDTAFTCLLMYGKFFLSFLVISEVVRTPRMLRIVIYGFICALFINSAFAVLQFIKGRNIEFPGLVQAMVGLNLKYKSIGETAFRPSGLVGHPNGLGDFITFLIPTAAILLVTGPRRLGKSTWWTILALSGIMAGTLLLTLSRGAWLSSFVAIMAAVYLGIRRGLLSPLKIMGLAGLVAVVIVGSFIIYPKAYLRITESDERSSLTRILMIEQAFEIAKHNPVLGVGYGKYQEWTSEYEPDSFGRYSKYYINQVKVGVVHNKYMLTLAEHGFVGLFLFLATLIASLLWLFPLRKWKSPVLFCLALGVASSLFAQIVFYNFDHFFSDQRNTLFFVFFGIGLALHRYNEQQNILLHAVLQKTIQQQSTSSFQLPNRSTIS